jgi:tetratricopeptide (TPR) repeat protein/cell division septation protein DedD
MLLTVAPSAGAVENWFERGLADIRAGNYQAAVDHFSKAIEAVPEDFEAYNNRGFAKISIGDYEGAIEDCSRSITINPGSAKAYNNRGLARLFIGEFDPAIMDFNQAITINPRYVDAYSNRCLAWARKEDYPQAIADCSEALHLNPRSAKALYSRGYARDRQGDPGGAMRDYIQVLRVKPDYAEAFNSLAWIMATSPDDRLRDGRRAVAYAQKAVDMAPEINFLDTLAAAYAEAGRFDEAIATENRIISLLAATRQTDAIAVHVKRMSRYEEGRPYREPLRVRPVSAVTDLQGELVTLDPLVFAPQTVHAAYQPAAMVEDLTSDVSVTRPKPRQMLLAQAEAQPPVTVPEAISQSIQTAPGQPVEINLTARPDDLALNFEIESVPYQGTLQGTLPHLMYSPRPGFEGLDRFTFRVHNAAGPSNLATITIVVGTPPAVPSGEEAAAALPEPLEETITPMESPSGAAVEAPPSDAAARPIPPSTETSTTTAPGSDAEEPEIPAAEVDDAPPPPAADPAPSPSLPPAQAPLATAPTPVPALPSDSRYTIQVRSVNDAADAAGIVAKLRAEGMAAFSHAVDIPEKGQWHRVFINGYPSLETAQEALGQLDPNRFKDAFIRRMPRDSAPPPILPQAALPASEPVEEPAVEPAATSEIESPSDAVPDDQAIAVSGRYPYSYQVKSYKAKEEAFQLGVELTTQGHRAFIGRGTMGTTGVWYRVFIGCYQSPEEAEQSRSEIAREGFPEAFLTPIGFTIAVAPDDSDPAGDMLESRLMASGFLPYRLPGSNETVPPLILVGGFRHADDAAQVMAALEQSGFKGRLRPR